MFIKLGSYSNRVEQDSKCNGFKQFPSKTCGQHYKKQAFKSKRKKKKGKHGYQCIHRTTQPTNIPKRQTFAENYHKKPL